MILAKWVVVVGDEGLNEGVFGNEGFGVGEMGFGSERVVFGYEDKGEK